MVSKSQASSFLVKRGLVRRIVRTFRPYSSKVTTVGLLIVVTAGLGVVNPLLIRVVFDSALFPSSGTPDLGLLWLLAGIMATITVFTGSLGVVQTYIIQGLASCVIQWAHREEWPSRFGINHGPTRDGSTP